MTAEILVIAAIRIAGWLPVLRWPLAGGILVDGISSSEFLDHLSRRLTGR